MSSWFRIVQRYSVLVLLSAAFPAELYSQITIKIWNPFGILSTNYNWEDGNNWIELSIPPSSNEYAKFENASDSVFISTSQTVTGLLLNGGTIAGTGAITVSDSMTWNGGKLSGSGTLTFESGSTAKIAGTSGTIAKLDGWNLVNDGIVNQQIPLELLNGSDIANDGTLNSVDSLILGAGTVVSGIGWVIVGDTLVVNGAATMSKLELLSTAVITGSGTLEIADSLIWSGATLTGGGTLRILNGAVARLASNEGTLSGWTLENNGDFHQDSDLTLVAGIVTNGGSYVMGASINDGGGSNVFSNAGTFGTAVGSGSISVPFNTTGTVDVVEGSVSVKGGGTAEGEFTITAPMGITFVSAPYAFDGPTFAGTGWTIVDIGVSATGTTTISNFDFTGYAGSLSGAGTVQVTDSMKWGAGRLNGTGELIIGVAAALITPEGIDSHLHITDHTLTNNGTVIQTTSMDVGGDAQIVNNGSYRIENASVYFEGASSPVFTNTQQLEFFDAYGFARFQIPFNNSGTVEIQAGTLPLSAGGSNSGTLSIIVDTAAIEITAGVFTLSDGTDVSGTGFFQIDGGTVSLGGAVSMDKFAVDSGVVEGNGNLTVRDTLLWGGGTFGGAGQLIIAEDGFMSIMGGLRAAPRVIETRALNNLGHVAQWANYDAGTTANILNSGTYDLMDNHVIVASGTPPGIFHNTGTLNKLSGPPNGGTNGRIEIPFANDSSLFVDQSNSLELSGGLTNFVDNVLEGGTFTIAGTLTFPGAAIDTNNAVLTLAGGSILDESGNPALSGLDLNKGTFDIENSFFSINSHIRNEGTFIIQPGCSLSTQGYTQTGGTTYFRSGGSGGLDPGEGTVNIEGGSFYGNGTIFGDLINDAEVFIGEPLGTLSVGTYQQSLSGILHVDIGGSSPGENHDRMQLPGGLAELNGAVNVKLINGFVPDGEQRVFTIMNHEGRTGTFASIVDLDAGDGIRMIADYASNALTNLVANFAPAFTQTLPDTTIDENQSLSFPLVASDPEDSSFFFSLLSPLQGVLVDSATGNFTWTPNFDQSGVHEIVVGVSDAFETALDTVIITVLHVNRLPIFTNVFPDTTVAEGQELQFSVEGQDLDLDSLLFGLTELPEGSGISATGLFSWTPSFSDSGSHTIVISLGDGIGAILDTAIVFVSNTNVPPLFVLNLPDTTVLENSTLSFSVTGSDFDLNALSFAKMEGPGGLSVSAAGEVEWATTYDDSGTHSVVLSLFDGIATVLDTATVIVSNVNRLPILTNALPDTTVAENQLLFYALEGTDLDSDLLSFSLSQAPGGAEISTGGEFTWTPSYSDSGSHVIIISIGDGIGEILDTVTVFVSNTNISPVFVLGLPDTTIQESSTLNFTVTGSDFDLNLLSFAKYEGPAALSVSSEGDVAWTTSHGDSGTHTVIISLSDGFTSVLDTASVIVANVNQLPSMVLSLPDTTIAEAQSLSFTVSAVDADEDPVSFSLVSGPEGAEITTGGLFSWTPTYSDSGSYTIIVSVGDGFGAVNDTATIIVTNVNRLPFFLSILPDTTIAENTTLSYNLTGSDADADVLSFTKVSGPAALTVSTGGQIEWSTSYSDSGSYSVVISLFDGLDAVNDTANITVLNVNRLPIFSAISDTSVAENDTLEFMVAATDPDGSPLTFSLVTGPSGSSLTANGMFSWTPSFLQAGLDTIVVGVNDGLGGVVDTALITVFNVNRLPGSLALLSPADDDTVQLAVPLTVDFRWSKSIDPDTDDTLRYLVRILGPVLDTTVVVETDTSVSMDLAGRLQSSSEYTWSVRVTDRSDTVNAQQGFSFRTSATITAVIDPGTLPAEFALSQNYPNPFNPSTTIAYDVPSQSLVTVQIFNMIGQLVSTLVDDEQPAGRYSITWRGTSESGVPVSSGIYFYRIHARNHGSASEFIQTRKLILIK